MFATALGRIEWYIPNQTYLADHLRNDCRHLTREERSRVNALVQAISEAKSKSYQSGFDYGSLFEVVQYPKYAESIQNLEPGTASPGRIFAAHEATLLVRAKRRLNDTRRKNRLATETPLSQAPAPYDSDDFDEAQRLESRTVDNGKPEDPIDTSKMFDVDTEENNDALNLPAGEVLP